MASELQKKLAGRFIVLDGPDGSGKSTQVQRLSDALTAAGLSVLCVKDPGKTTIGERIRSVLLHHDLAEMDVRCETFLFMASRAQLVGELVDPAMKAGQVVIGDRFISSTCAYQGAAGFDVQKVIELGHYAVGTTWPALTVILDVPVEAGFERTGRRPHHAGRHRKRQDDEQGLLISDATPDAMEARPIAFHRRVRELFLQLPETYPGRVEIVDGNRPADEVHADLMELIRRVDL